MDDYAFLLSPSSSLVALLYYYTLRFNRRGETFVKRIKALREVHYLAPLVLAYLEAYTATITFLPVNTKFIIKAARKMTEGDSNASYLLSLVLRKEATLIFPKQQPQLSLLYTQHYPLLNEDWELSRKLTQVTPTVYTSKFADTGLLLNGRIFYNHTGNEISYYSNGAFYDFNGFPVTVNDDDSLSIF